MPTSPFLDLDAIHTPTVGGTPPASWGAKLRDNQLSFARPPGCVIARTTAQAISHNQLTSLQFTAPDERDTDNFHNPGSTPERITIPSGLGGWYDVGWIISWASGSTARRISVVSVNGTARAGVNSSPTPSGGLGMHGAEFVSLQAGDYMTLDVLQDTGSALNVSGVRLWLTLRAWA